MKKLFYLGFCLVLATGVGCAISNYELITDNDQVANGQGTGVVNTNGKAHIRESFQVATIWPDGSTDETLWFVDQKANGDRTLSTYNNYGTGYYTGTEPTFHDDLYCNPDRNGCASVTSWDPEIGDVDIYDYSGNPNCLGYRSLVYLTSTTRYYGECGRAALGLSDRLALLNMGQPATLKGAEALRWVASPMNTSIFMDNLSGTKVNIPVTGVIPVTMSGDSSRKTALDITSPSLRGTFDAMSNFYANYGSRVNQIEVVYNGLSFTKSFATLNNPAQRLRDRINGKY
jgi:hypothetical protein